MTEKRLQRSKRLVWCTLAFALIGASCAPAGVKLYKINMSGQSEQMALIHGWADDMDVCLEIADFLNGSEPNRYSCGL